MRAPTSRLNKTPPTGAPKATEMPEAEAADKTSRFRAAGLSILERTQGRPYQLTLIVIDTLKGLHKQIGTTASDVYKRTFFA